MACWPSRQASFADERQGRHSKSEESPAGDDNVPKTQSEDWRARDYGTLQTCYSLATGQVANYFLWFAIAAIRTIAADTRRDDQSNGRTGTAAITEDEPSYRLSHRRTKTIPAHRHLSTRTNGAWPVLMSRAAGYIRAIWRQTSLLRKRQARLPETIARPHCHELRGSAPQTGQLFGLLPCRRTDAATAPVSIVSTAMTGPAISVTPIVKISIST